MRAWVLPSVLLAVSAAVGAAPVPTASGNNATRRAAWTVAPEFGASVALGLSFSGPQEGIIVGGDNNVGAQVWATDDGGRVTNPATLESGGSPVLMLLAGAAVRESAVASGVFAAWSSEDSGGTFRPAAGLGAIGPAQSVDGFFEGGDLKFVITGDTMTHNGVAVSDDGGLTFGAGVEVFEDKTIAARIGARYFAAASPTAWFVSGGRWPSNSRASTDASVHHLTESIFVKRSPAANETTFGFTQPEEQRGRSLQDDDPFTAGIALSSDGGQSWRTVFESDTLGFYFNQISCWDATRCAVVAEGGGAARILVTRDGGLSWQQTLQASGSIMAIQALQGVAGAEGEGWAGGGILGFPTFTGHYWHTLDYGETWELNELPGAYAFDLSFPPGQNSLGYSTVLTPAASALARYE
jgi:photosystem II stability/assembly factor-like uncharacterized protein